MTGLFALFERLVDPFPPTDAAPAPSRLLPFCRYHVQGIVWALLAMAGMSALIAVMEVSLFGFMGQLVDWLSARSPDGFLEAEWPTLLFYSLLALVFIPALVVFQSLLVHQSLMGNFAMRVRWRAHRYLLGQSFGFFHDELAGGIATKLMQTSLAVREAVMKLLDILVYIAVYFLSIVVLVATADWRLAAPLLVWLLLYSALLYVMLPRLQAVSARQADARSVMTGRVVDAYNNIGAVKLFSHHDREAEYARDGMGQFLDTVHPQMRLVTVLSGAIWTLNSLLLFATAALAIGLWMSESVSVGAIAVAIALSLRINGMSHWIMWETSGLFEQIGTLRDGMSILSRPLTVTDAPDATPLRAHRGEIDVRDVHFTYGRQKVVFDGLDMHVAAGEKVGLVGRSGAGKSTLVNLLLRFYDVQSGVITIDGQDISRVTQESLRASIGMVTQEPSLLHRSIRDNIAYGRPEATDEQIIAAARRAQAWTFIEGVEDPQGRRGLDAHVGDRGVRLSGGQRQRIAIARVMLKDAPILVLDEATSALDSEVEAAIQATLGELMAGKTVIAIAHRLSTIAAMDRLLVLDQGRIVEQGSHQALVRAGGIYSRLWAHQSGGFIAEHLDAEA